MRKHISNIEISGTIEGIRYDYKPVRLHYERTQYETPKSYRKVGLVSREVGIYSYESGLITVYRNKQGILKFEVYHSGNFYPYFGTLEIL